MLRLPLATATVALSLSLSSHVAFAAPAASFQQWGEETQAMIDKGFWIPDRNLYTDEVQTAAPAPKGPAFMWGCGVELTALVGATRLEPKTYAPQLLRYSQGLQIYWQDATNKDTKGIGGYDVLPVPKPLDRYYDDNAWVVLAFAEAYEVTGNVQYRDWAERTLRFVLSGEDTQLGGGLYWKESEHSSKNTCTNAPAISGALRLYQLTRKPEYLATARRLYTWTNAHLQDTDGLYFDNIKLDGTVDKAKFSYNTALMIRANCLLHAVTKEPQYLTEAQRVAHAAAAHWVKPSGAMSDDAQFAHLLLESFLYVYDEDHDPQWKTLAARTLSYVHHDLRDPHGYYGKRWDTPQPTALDKAALILQASAARAYWIGARYKLTNGE